jgi:MYXO-CTERM domain-containing protein
LKGLLIWILFGALLGATAASFIVPPMLSWYNEAGYLAKGGQPAAMVNLPDVVRYATTRLIRGQAIGAGIGAVVFLALGLAFGGRRRRSAQTATPSQRVQ